jgi:hypothetical protein
MRRGINSLFIAVLLLPTSGFVAAYRVNFSFCEVGSVCKKCVETVGMIATVDPIKRIVTVWGRTPEGIFVSEVLTSCQIKLETEWRCETVREAIEVQSGKATFRTQMPLSVDGKKLEVCMRDG